MRSSGGGLGQRSCNGLSLSVFNAVYRYMQCAGQRRSCCGQVCARELEVLVGLAPLLVAELDQAVVPAVVCADASEYGQGVVAKAVEVPCIEQVATQPSLDGRPRAVGDSGQAQLAGSTAGWKTIVASPWQHQEHINVLEVRALLTAVRWLISRPSALGTRVLALTDSQVAAYSVSKGRSSSRSLLSPLRSLASSLLAADLWTVRRHEFSRGYAYELVKSALVTG